MASPALPETSDRSLHDRLIKTCASPVTEQVLKEARSLIEQGANPQHIREEHGTWGARDQCTALTSVLQGKYRCKEDDIDFWRQLVMLLLAHGADPNAEHASYDWRGCGHTGKAFEMVYSDCSGDTELMKAFIRAGADARMKSVQHIHSMRTDGEIVQHLLNQVVANNDSALVRTLLDHGADANAVNTTRICNERGYNQNESQSALVIACREKNHGIVQALLESGADPNLQNRHTVHEKSQEESPTDDPRDLGYVSPVKCVQVSHTALHTALESGCATCVALLVAHGADASKDMKRGAQTVSCKDMAADDEALKSALHTRWSPSTHLHFPQKARELVWTTLLVAKRNAWDLPPEILFRILRDALSNAKDGALSPAGSSST